MPEPLGPSIATNSSASSERSISSTALIVGAAHLEVPGRAAQLVEWGRHLLDLPQGVGRTKSRGAKRPGRSRQESAQQRESEADQDQRDGERRLQSHLAGGRPSQRPAEAESATGVGPWFALPVVEEAESVGPKASMTAAAMMPSATPITPPTILPA